MDLNELLTIKDKEQRNHSIRRAFASFSSTISIAGKEREALVILANLTYKAADKVDLSLIKAGKARLKDEQVFEQCIDEVQWFHTHNLKYPDARVSKQRIIVEHEGKLANAVSSANVPRMLGWSHNGPAVNNAKLFSSYFIWQGMETNLTELVINHSEYWVKIFTSLGVNQKRFTDMKRRLSEFMPAQTLPESISFYSKQVRFPYLDDYCAITPVVSHSLQYYIQQYQTNPSVKTTTIRHDKPYNVGNLAASLGGNITALHYPPLLNNRKAYSFFNSRSKRYKQGSEILDKYVLRDEKLHSNMGIIAGEHLAITMRLRRLQRVAALRKLRKNIALWLAPIFEWRDSIEQSTLDDLDCDSLEFKLLTLPEVELPSLVRDLNIRFHEHLQDTYKAKRFAYHEQLLEPVKSQLLWLLTELIREDKEEKVSETSGTCYLHFSELRIENAEAIANPYLVGTPSLTALAGLMHHYQRRLQQRIDANITVQSCAWFLREFDYNNHHILPEFSKCKLEKKEFVVQRSGIMDNKISDMTVDFVFKVQLENGINLNTFNAQFIHALPSRFAGGGIFFPTLDNRPSWMRSYPETNRGELFSVLSRLPASGCWIGPEESELKSLKDLLAKLSFDSTLKPIQVGYQFLEQPGMRDGAIAKYHAYAEPLIGLARSYNPIDVRLKGSKFLFENVFWSFDLNNQSMIMCKDQSKG